MKKLLNIFALCFLISCSNNNNGTSEDKTGTPADSLQTSTENKFTVVGDSIVVPAFEIELKLSDNAEKKLTADKETIIVQAYFEGVPKDTTSAEYLESGKKSIGSYKFELSDQRLVKFENVKISKKAFDLLADQNFEVLINIFSGRRTSPNNLLDGDILQDGIDSIKTKRHTLNVKLIKGD